MILGYNTNGFAFHDPLQAIDVLGEIGYRSLAVTIDHSWLNPYRADLDGQIERVRSKLASWRMQATVETGARFLLDSRRKHQPTLVSESDSDREIRSDFLKRCIDIAAGLGSRVVSLWSGLPDDYCTTQQALDRLAKSLEPIVAEAEDRGVTLGFEPEPGMVVESTAHYERLKRWIDSPHLKLTMDVGHLFCLGEVPIASFIHRYASDIVNVHIEDMRAGAHEHLMFGEGDISFPPVLCAFAEAGYTGPLHVELSRHSHNAVVIARQAYEFLSRILSDLETTQQESTAK